MEDEIKGYYITPQIIFRSIQDLVDFYTIDNRGLAVALSSVCCLLTPDHIYEYCDTSPYESVYQSLESFDYIVSYV